jgi:predicted O-methyltransferase YrrM
MSAAAAWTVARAVPGWLTAAEARFLFEGARAVPAGGRIVEIGSFLGRSTVCLALGSAAGNGAEVVAVDPHIGSPRHAHLLGCTDTWPHFLANLDRCGVRGRVQPLHATSAVGARATAGPVHFLFVDGSHELADVRADIAAWFPKLAPGALVAFHDSWHMAGVRQATSELLRTRPGLRAPRLVDTITAVTATGTAAPPPGHLAFRALRWVRGPAGFLRLTWRGTRLTPVAPVPA